MNVDPTASMRRWAVEIELAGRVFEIPALSAADWWPVLATGQLDEVIGMIPGDLDDLLLNGELTAAELTAALREAVEEVAGRSYHAALVICVVASAQWSLVGGLLAQRGFRWEEMPLGAALDAAYAILLSHMDKENVDQFQAILENEALSQPGRKRQPSQKIMSEFESMAGPKPTGGVKATAGQSGSGRPRTRPRRPPHPRGGPSAAPIAPPGPPAGSDPPANSAVPAAGV